MCYVVAKNANKIGSVAIRMKLGKPVVQLKAEMNSRYLNKRHPICHHQPPLRLWRIRPLPLRGHDSGVQGGSREAVISHKAVIPPQTRGAQVLTDLRAAFLYSPHFSLTQ